MGLWIKNFDVEVHWQIWFLEGREVDEKLTYRGNCLKSGVWTVCRFKVGGLVEKRGWCFWGGFDASIHTITLSVFAHRHKFLTWIIKLLFIFSLVVYWLKPPSWFLHLLISSIFSFPNNVCFYCVCLWKCFCFCLVFVVFVGICMGQV